MATSANIFISYASDTKPLAEELTKALESQGIEPWVDFKDLQPGQRSREELERAIAALASSWAHSEKKLLPVVFGEGEPPPFLRNWVSLRIDPQREALTWTRHVLGALRNPRNEAAPGLAPQNREERNERFDEVRKAAEELWKGQMDEPPAIPPKVQS